jgi:hypothetical protein
MQLHFHIISCRETAILSSTSIYNLRSWNIIILYSEAAGKPLQNIIFYPQITVFTTAINYFLHFNVLGVSFLLNVFVQIILRIFIRLTPNKQQFLTCGSIMSGQRSELERMVAFSVDILSLGNPSLFQTAIWASSVSSDSGSRPSVMGTGGWNNRLSSISLAVSLHNYKKLTIRI